MTFNVITEDGSFTINFVLDEDVTFCNIYDNSLDFVIAAGHTILSPDDDYNPVQGMKNALRRALDAPPSLFDREVRGLIWESFWEGVDTDYLVASNYFDLYD